MEENKNETVVSKQENVEVNNNHYIEAIKEMKENTVDKEAYLKLEAENKQLLDAYINGKELDEKEKSKEPEVDIKALRESIFSEDCTNLDYITNSLKLREEILKKGGKDIFLPNGKNIKPTKEDLESVERVVECLNYCVEEADGNDEIFTLELQKHLVDPILPKSNNKKNLFN